VLGELANEFADGFPRPIRAAESSLIVQVPQNSFVCAGERQLAQFFSIHPSALGRSSARGLIAGDPKHL
jgi:hypothetical protein